MTQYFIHKCRGAAQWYRVMARLARTLMTTKAATMKTPDSTADAIVITGDTFLLPLSSSPKSLARLPRYTYSKVPTHDCGFQEPLALFYRKLAVN